MITTVKIQFMYLSLHLVLFYMNGGNIRGSRDCSAVVQFSSGHDDIHELSRVYQAGNVKFEPHDKDLLVFLTTLSQVPEATILFVSPSSAFLYSTHTWDHPVLVFFCQHTHKIEPRCQKWQISFGWPVDSLLCIQHGFFVCSSNNGHWRLFPCLHSCEHSCNVLGGTGISLMYSFHFRGRK